EIRPTPEARPLEQRCAAVWEKRHQLLNQLGENADLRGSRLDLALLWIDLRLRLAPAAGVVAVGQAARRAASQVAERFGTNCVLLRERQAQAAALGLTDLAEQSGRRAADLSPQTAWEHFATARALLRWWPPMPMPAVVGSEPLTFGLFVVGGLA